MKKIIFFLVAICASINVSVYAQLTEYYPNSQRYLFNEYNRDSLPYDSIIEFSPISPSYTVQATPGYHYEYGPFTILAQKYHRNRADSTYIYGVSFPIYVFQYYSIPGRGYTFVGHDINWRENDSLWSVITQSYLDSMTREGHYAYILEKDDLDTSILSVIDSVQLKTGVSVVTGNYFEFSNLGNWSFLSGVPNTLSAPVVEVYFKEPHLVTDSFWVGGQSLHQNWFTHLLTNGFNALFFAIYDKSENDYFETIGFKKKIRLHFVCGTPTLFDWSSNTGSHHKHYWGGPFPIVTPPPCMQPCSLRVENIHYDSVRVQWEVPVRVGVCRVEYGPAGFALGSGTVIDSVWGGECLIGGLQPNTTYDVYVSGWCKDQECWSGWTDTSFTTDEACPTKFNYWITAVTDTSMQVEWAVPDGAVYSEVWYGEQGSEWDEGVYVTPIYPGATGMCHLQITGLEPGTAYTVSIRHWCEYGNVYSEWQSTGATTIGYYTVTTEVNNDDWGSVTGGGEYLAGSQAMLNAIPANEFCHFVMWDDGVTYQMRMVTVTGDMTFRALFYCDTCTESISEAAAGEITLTPNPAHGEVTVSSSTTIQRITIHDMQGREVAVHYAGSMSVTIPLRNMPRGTYIVTVTTDKATTTRKLVIE